MRAEVIKQFRDAENGRAYRKRDVITVSKSRFDELKGTFLKEASSNQKLTPKRDSGGKCLICNNNR